MDLSSTYNATDDSTLIDDIDPLEAYDNVDLEPDSVSIHSLTDDSPALSSVLDESPETLISPPCNAISKPARRRKAKKPKVDLHDPHQRQKEQNEIDRFLRERGGPTLCPSRYATGAVPEVYWDLATAD